MSDGGTEHQHRRTFFPRNCLFLIICWFLVPGSAQAQGVPPEGKPIQQRPYALWNASDPSPCNWTGISCHNGRVTEVNLTESSISGKIFDGFSELTELSRLDLSKNTICGAIPTGLNQCRPLNLSGLSRLEVLDVTLNRLNGSIQSNFAEFCTNLVVFNISVNRFRGGIRDLFDRCPRLKFLDLSANMFEGDIWQGFSNLQDHGGHFPSNCSLSLLDLSQNNLYGTFPNSIFNCRNLTNLNLWGNEFGRRIPSGIGSLSELEYLFLGKNNFDRLIPEQLLNCSKLASLDISKNNFGPEVQDIFGRFTQVKFLILHSNNYSRGIESSGILKLKNIVRLDLSFNNFSGQLPVEITQMPQLKFLILAYNNFSGVIPTDFGNMTTLQALDLSHNMLSGPIPPSVGKLTSLLWLTLADNSLSGQIPPEIGNCRSLLWLNLANNQLSGEIPLSIAEMGSSPIRLSASSGECLAMRRWLPVDYPPFSFVYTLMNRKNCRRIWDNLLMGHGIIPICLNRSSPSRTLTISGYIQLSGNKFTGEIPVQIGKMTWLSLIHLNHNRLSGRLPAEIGKLRWSCSMCRQTSSREQSPDGRRHKVPAGLGPLPEQLLRRNSSDFERPLGAEHVQRLLQPTPRRSDSHYGAAVHVRRQLLPRRPSHQAAKHEPVFPSNGHQFAAGQRSRRTLATDGGVLDLLLYIRRLLRLGIPVSRLLRRRPPALVRRGPAGRSVSREGSSSSKRRHDVEASSSSSTATSGMSFEAAKVIRLDKAASFTYLDIVAATRGFSDDMVLGRGGFGVVYRGVLPDGRPVAVKKLQRQGLEGEREFQAEMEVLCRGGAGGWPHPNLKLLVYEYMQGGSLEDVIADWARLGWERRLAVAAGVARALVFLHHECFPAVVHRDVKASNVLLDGAGRARVTDFGLARVVRPGDSHVSTVVAGTVGYVAPSTGIRGRPPRRGTCTASALGRRRGVPGGVGAAGKPRRPAGRGGGCSGEVTGMDPGDGSPTEGLWAMGKLLGLGMRCTDESPQARPNMKQVLEDLLDIIHPSPLGKPPEISLAVSGRDGGGRGYDILACTV
ncbi:unnamed protein product [Spirodela intermedia]|uniref:Protein kinase domain-containing protein n=1 Tax=Spirodela intermedia TaxID=51605 RepID=A0A7I8IJY5_SPIIN|nr:unnamed protein product [Spirodela intermedia]CAA6657458.1 unnamed protein product [Spirodela intermedia]